MAATIARREDARHARRRRSDSRQRLPQVSRLLGDHAQPPRSGPGDRAATIDTHDEALAAAAQLRDELDLEAGIVTLDKDGMALAHRDGRKRSSRRGRGRSTTSPAPATWS